MLKNFKIKIPIWLKTAILTAVVFFALAEVFTQYFKNRNINDFKEYSQNSLLEKAKLIASYIDAENHNQAIMMTDSAQRYYSTIQQKLENSRRAIDLSEEIFTVFMHDDTTFCYGVMSNFEVARQNCAFRDESLIPIFKNSFINNQPEYSDIYFDRNGAWISGFAPIADKNGKVVAVVEVDLSFNEYNERLDDFVSWSQSFRALSLLASILIGGILGIFIGKPVSRIASGMSRISKQDFSSKINVKPFNRRFPDETVLLTDSFNKMSDRLNKTLIDLREANEKLTELNHSKTVFLNLVAHELRTPLTGLGFIDYLRKSNSCNEDDKEIIDSINESYQRIKEFVNSADQYIRALNYEIDNTANCNVNDTIQNSLFEVNYKAEEKNIKIHYSDSSDNASAYIETDVLNRVLETILDNAIKFSSSGSEINVKAEKYEELIKISIRDKGRGIKPQSLEKIFEPYYVDQIYSHSKGTGVNLPIVKVLLSKFKGEIIAKSYGENNGAEFILNLKTIVS